MKAVIKNNLDGQIWLNGRLVEINPEYLRTEDLVSSPRLLDGFMPCPSCKDVLVLEGYCAGCRRLGRDLEAKRLRLQCVDRIDNGSVEFEELETEGPASPWAVLVIFCGALCSTMLTMTVFWFGFRGLIRFCLEHSK